MIGDVDRFEITGSQTVRVGCDLVALDEIAGSLSRFGERFVRRVFTEVEIAECSGADHVARFAARFAAKEAAVKALSIPGLATPFHEIEISRPAGVPEVSLSGSLAHNASEQGWLYTRLSLSHTDCHAMAVLTVICDGPASTGTAQDRCVPDHHR